MLLVENAYVPAKRQLPVRGAKLLPDAKRKKKQWR
jgi:hypothetical protein